MCVIPGTHASTHTTSLMHVKDSMHHLRLWHWLSGTLQQRKWKKEQKSNLIVGHFSLTFVKLSLASMLLFYEWLQNKGKFLGVNTIISLAYINLPVYLTVLELINFSNPEAYSEPCQTYKIAFFCKNSQWLKALNFFC